MDTAEPGRRTALALAGLDRSAAERGSVVVADPSWRATTRVDAVVRLLATAPRPLSQRSRVRFHLGTVEVMARVTPADGPVAPGGSALVRLRLDDPVVARWGDRAVIRSYSPVTTIGGAVIVDPWPPSRPRRPANDVRRAGTDVRSRVQALVESSGPTGVAIEDLPVRAGVPRDDVQGILGQVLDRSAGITRIRDMLVGATALAEAEDAVIRALDRHHADSPLEPGMPLELVRQSVRADRIADYVLGRLVERGIITQSGGLARRSGHRAALDSGQEAVGRAVLESLVAAGFEGRTLAEIEPLAPGGTGRQLVEYLVRQGTAVRVGQDRYYHQRVLDDLLRKALGEIRKPGGGTPAQLRECLGLTRKYLIPLLEWMDGRGLTVRTGESRVATPAAERYLSEAKGVQSGA